MEVSIDFEEKKQVPLLIFQKYSLKVIKWERKVNYLKCILGNYSVESVDRFFPRETSIYLYNDS